MTIRSFYQQIGSRLLTLANAVAIVFPYPALVALSLSAYQLSMNLRNTEIFCEIATQRSFSKAAAARDISQPAVSQALQQLEEQIGATLVDRSQRPIALTAAGQIYYERCQRWLEDYQEIEDAVHACVGRIVGRVRVASIYSVGLLQMSGYVNRFCELYPDVKVDLSYAQTDEVYNRILRDECDVGIVSFPRDGGDIGCIRWQDQEMALAVSPEHELAHFNELKLGQLDQQDFVSFTADLTIGRNVERLLKTRQVCVNIVHRFDNVENVKRAVEIGLGAAILPLVTMRREIEFGTLRAISLVDVDFVRPLGIVHRRNKHLSAAAEKFVELLRTDSQADESCRMPGNLVATA